MALTRPASAILITFDSFEPTAFSEVVNPDPNSSSGMSTVHPGALTELVLPELGNIVLSIKRENGATFDLIDNSLLSQQSKAGDDGLDSFGGVSLDPFSDTSPSAFIFNFLQIDSDGGENDSEEGYDDEDDEPLPIRSFSALIGDFGGDGDGFQMFAYSGFDGTGDLVASTSELISLPRIQPSRDWTEKRISLISGTEEEPGDGFRSIVLYAGGGLGSANFSVYLDRLFFAVGPDPFDPFIDDPNTLGDDDLLIPEPASLALLVLGGVAMLPRRRA